MATLEVKAEDFILQSTWTCTGNWVGNGQIVGYKLPSGQPTKASRKVTFPYSLPSGAVVTSAKVWVKIGGLFTGSSILNINGNKFKYRNGQDYGADVLLSDTSGSIDATFNYKANGNTVDAKKHISTASFSNVRMTIEYEGAAGKQEAVAGTDSTKFTVPPQSVCIYHQETGKLYMFDGVTKITHGLTTKIEENPSGGGNQNNKDKWINNAKNEPDKITLEVVMSDVYSDSGNMTLSTGWDESMQQQAYNASKNAVISDFTRSGNAARVLHRLKESRAKLSVITPQYVHVDMLISGVTINQDDTCPNGWYGQIEFQHAYKPKAKKKETKAKDTGAKPNETNTYVGVAKLYGNDAKTYAQSVKD